MEIIKSVEHIKLKRLLHTGVTVASIFTLVYGVSGCLIGMRDPKFIDLEFMQHGYEYSPYFLSLWVIGFNILYYHSYTAIDIIEVYYNSNKKLLKLADNIHRAASYFLFTIIFPMSLYVQISFWTLYTCCRSTMYPPQMDDLLPPWVNHCLHTAPPLLSLLYMLVSNRHTPSKKASLTGIIPFLIFYWGLFLSIRFVKGKWIYMVMNEFSSVQIALLIGGSLIVPNFFVLLGFEINSKIQRLKAQLSPLLSSP